METWIDDLARAMARGRSRKAFIKLIGAAIAGVFVAGTGAVEAKKAGSGGKVKGCKPACTGGQVCQAGQCVCPAGQALCAGACVDLSADNSQCGACGHACPSGQTCQGGQCVGGGGSCAGRTCAAGEGCCGNQCVATQTDPQNCGGCGKACTAGQTCRGGACVSRVCRPGQITCPNGCCEADSPVCCPNGCCDNDFPVCCGSICCPADTHCGPNETCVPGGCPTGQTSCDGTCTNLQTDSSHCGACDQVCTGGKVCKGGQCVAGSDCGATCRFDCAGPMPFVNPPTSGALQVRELAGAIPVTVDDYTVMDTSPLCEPSSNPQLTAIDQLIADAARAEANGDVARAAQLRTQAQAQLTAALQTILKSRPGRPDRLPTSAMPRPSGPGGGLKPPAVVADTLLAERQAEMLGDNSDRDAAFAKGQEAYAAWAGPLLDSLADVVGDAAPGALAAVLRIGRDGSALGLSAILEQALQVARGLSQKNALAAAKPCPPSKVDFTKLVNWVDAQEQLGITNGIEGLLKPTAERYIRQQAQSVSGPGAEQLKLAAIAEKFGLSELSSQILSNPTRVDPPDCVSKFNCACNGQVYDSRSQCLNECHVNLKCFASCICCPIKS